jgi:hypothetical protein
MRQSHRWSSDNGFGQDLAPGALHLQPLQPRIGHAKLLRTRRTAVLRTGLPQSVLAQMRVLQRTHIRRKDFLPNPLQRADGFARQLSCSRCAFCALYIYMCVLVLEMCDGLGEDMAHGTLFLRPMRQTIRRGRIPRAGGTPVLQGRLLRHVRSQVRWMHSANNRELRFGLIHSVAFKLFRLQGKLRSSLKCFCINVLFFLYVFSNSSVKVIL